MCLNLKKQTQLFLNALGVRGQWASCPSTSTRLLYVSFPQYLPCIARCGIIGTISRQIFSESVYLREAAELLAALPDALPKVRWSDLPPGPRPQYLSPKMSMLPPDVHDQLVQLLQALQSSDNTIRPIAEEKLSNEWTATRPDVLLMGLVEQIQVAQDVSVSRLQRWRQSWSLISFA